MKTLVIKDGEIKSREIIKSKRNGGKGMVWIERFLIVRYVSICVKLSMQKSLKGRMVRYAAGSVLRKWKLGDVDLKSPVCFGAPWFYVRIESSID